jgi:hypothetical protein
VAEDARELARGVRMTGDSLPDIESRLRLETLTDVSLSATDEPFVWEAGMDEAVVHIGSGEPGLRGSASIVSVVFSSVDPVWSIDRLCGSDPGIVAEELMIKKNL